MLNKPQVAGIVTEYNPFHSGHGWQIAQLREMGAETVVCVMSGAFVQRAEPAFLPPHIRAEAAIAGGADLVLRLPLAYATASAEAFALGAVGILAQLGVVDTLAFGSETGDVGPMRRAAALLETPAFEFALGQELGKGVAFAVAREAALRRLCPEAADTLARPNDILGVEYCKALNKVLAIFTRQEREEYDRQHPKRETIVNNGVTVPFFGVDGPFPQPLAIPRRGAAHDGVPDAGTASASWLRGQALQDGVDAMDGFVPEACLELYRLADAAGETIGRGRWETAMLARLKGLSAGRLAGCAAAGEGLEDRLADSIKGAVDLDGLYAGAKSKRFAHSRVRRLALQAALGLPVDVPELPPFAHVLAAGPRGLNLLRQMKGRARIPVDTSAAKLAKTSDEAARLMLLEAAAEDLYAFCQKVPRGGGRLYTQPAFIQKGR